MQTHPTLVSVEEYLNTSFDDGDREYVDGVIVNLGEKTHSKLQRKLVGFFIAQESTLQTYCFPGQRVQVKATRFRVPDVCVYIGAEPEEEVFRTPPFLVVEILSKDDRASDLQEKNRRLSGFRRGLRLGHRPPKARRNRAYCRREFGSQRRRVAHPRP
jgi:Uma2 family endonuclease